MKKDLKVKGLMLVMVLIFGIFIYWFFFSTSGYSSNDCQWIELSYVDCDEEPEKCHTTELVEGDEINVCYDRSIDLTPYQYLRFSFI